MRDLDVLDVGARREPVRALLRPLLGQTAPYFADHVREELAARFDHGTRVVTTLDLTL
jgi:hypothetical protein